MGFFRALRAVGFRVGLGITLGEMDGRSPTSDAGRASLPDLYSPDGWAPASSRAVGEPPGFPPSFGVWGASMNPLLTEVSTMTITSPIHSFFRSLNRSRSRVQSYPEALQERHLTLPRRINDPASAASAARALLLNRREDVTFVL